MRKAGLFKSIMYTFCILCLMLTCFVIEKIEVKAVSIPGISVVFDPTDESVIVEGMPGNSDDGSVEYRLEGYMNYEGERVETFCYGPSAKPYDVPEKMAYIFNWAGKEFVLPCSGDYEFTAYVTAHYGGSQGPVQENGPKTTITITLHKKDESTNWGPGLPNTTVETYDLKQIQGKDKIIEIIEPEYTWIINGVDIDSVPEKNISLKVTSNPENFNDAGVEDFFGNSLVCRFNIEHNGEFGFVANLDYTIGAEYAGKYANLFYVIGDGTFEYMGGAVVTESGVASFSFTHASDYVVAITDVGYIGQELNPKVEEPKVEETESEEPKVEETESEEPQGEALEENGMEEMNKDNDEGIVQEETEAILEEQESGQSQEMDKEITAGGAKICMVVGIIVVLAVSVILIVARARRKPWDIRN